MRPVRILFVNENIGGHATQHAYLRRGLESAPEVLPTFLDVPPPRLARKLVAAPVPGLARLDLDLQPLRYQLAQSAVVRRRLRGLLPQADAVHVYTHNAVLLSAAALRTVPTVVGLDGTNEQNARTLPYRRATRGTEVTIRATRRFEERVYAAATLLVAQSEWAAASLRDDYGIPADRIRIVRYGMPVGPVPERRLSGRPEITFVGTSMDRKGGWRLLDAWRRHLRDRADLNLVTLEDVPGEPGLRVHRDVRPGDGRIEEILARTAVFAFPSEIDKSSWAVLEAMHAGVPVVSTRVGGLGELVVDGVTGLLVEPRDDGALARALLALVDDEGRREAMGAAGRRRVEEHFDVRRTTARVVDVVQEARDLFRPVPRPSS
jgi:alpha-maltose-1-phosphate synthase